MERASHQCCVAMKAEHSPQGRRSAQVRDDLEARVRRATHVMEESRLQRKFARFVEHHRTESLILSAVILYVVTVSVLIAVDHDQSSLRNAHPQIYAAFTVAQFLFLFVFLMEIMLKVVAFEFFFFSCFWNCFDTVVVLICFALTVGELAFTGNPALIRYLRLRGILRIGRMLVAFHKHSLSLPYFPSHIHDDKDFRSPVERIVVLLRGLQTYFQLNRSTRRQLRWAVDVVTSRRLYEPVVIGDRGVLDKADDAWLQTASHQYKRSSAASKDWEDCKRQSTTGCSGGAGRIDEDARAQESERSVRRLSLHAQAALANFNSWDFDMHDLDKQTSGNSLNVAASRCFYLMDSVEQLSLKNSKLCNYVNRIQTGYSRDNPFHNHIHAADVTQ
eukprot:GHVQ01012685.1.p1 GENE.GHVQ01012685.1~~GHVQ01012685.1.p1  ORF type:complete len:389 (-),score=36.87 GHVQ01012685.1:2794-3960(-)